MKICFVNAYQLIPEIGGTERVCHILKDGFERRGIKVYSFFAYQKDKLKEGEFVTPDVENQYSGVNIEYLCRIVKEKYIQIIICTSYLESHVQLCAETKKRLGTKIVYVHHRDPLEGINHYWDFYDKNIQNKSWYKYLYYRLKLPLVRYYNFKRLENGIKHWSAIEEYDAIVTLCKSHQKLFRALTQKKNREKVSYIWNPIRLSDSSFEKKEKVVLVVGRLSFHKRVDRMLRIWKDVEPQVCDWRLVVLGDGEEMSNLAALSQELKLKNISFEGNTPSEPWFKKSSIICSTSSSEGLPMVLLEGLSYGCVPIVYNCYKSIKDIIENEYNGVLVSPFNQSLFSQKLIDLILNDGFRRKLSENGKTSVKKFEEATISLQWINLFESLLNF